MKSTWEKEQGRERMEKRLYESAKKGSVQSLTELLQEDPLLLDKITVLCISDTPLHIASMLGHTDLVKKILNLKPDIARELDSCGCSPLHLAAAKGHLEIVKELLSADPNMAMVRNFDGRTALHVAALKGRVEVLAEMVQAAPDSALVLTDRGETGLHMCVRNNKVEALKVLVKAMVDGELLDWKDCEGNTVLHIAVAKKQIENINFLLTSRAVEVNTLNRNNLTALDILRQSPRDLRDLEIEHLIRRAGGLSAKDLNLITNEFGPAKVPQVTKRLSTQLTSLKPKEVKHKHTDWLGRKRSALMVVASLIATVAFQAGLTPPGGVWQDDYQVDSDGKPVSDPHIVGQSVMAYKDPLVYGQFMIFNTIAFLSSLSIILLLVSGLPLKRRRWMWLQMVTMWIAITAQVATYFISLRNMSPKDNDHVKVQVQSALRQVTSISVLTWLCLMGLVFLGNVVRMNKWILRKYGIIKEKEEKYTIESDDDQEE
ncbi:hypothetical protein NMG60_11013566 [Bertholletia excelsa]